MYKFTSQETTKDVQKVEKLQQLHYLIQLLLPVMEKMNLEQSIELETEAKIKGSMTGICKKRVSSYKHN